MKWNLSSIYPSFKSENFISDIQLLEDSIHNIYSWMEVNFKTNDSVISKIEYFIKFKNEVSDLINKLGTFSYLTSSADAKNVLANQNFNKILVLEQKVKSVENEFRGWLLRIDDICYIIHSAEALNEYEFYLNGLIEEGKHAPSKGEIRLLGKMKSVSSNAWESLYRRTISNYKVEIDFRAKTESYNKIAEPITWAYNSIKGEQIIEAELKGYDSVLQMAMKDYKLKEETLHAMFQSIKKYTPVIQRGIICKAKVLGHNNTLHFHDLYAPLGKLEKNYTFDEVRLIILDNLKHFGGRMY